MASEVQGYEKVMAQLGRISTIKLDTEKAATVILQKAKELVPVRTGFLRDSGVLVGTGYGYHVAFQANYAAFVEFGTSKMAAQPYLRPAIDASEHQVLQAQAQEVTEEIKDVL